MKYKMMADESFTDKLHETIKYVPGDMIKTEIDEERKEDLVARKLAHVVEEIDTTDKAKKKAEEEAAKKKAEEEAKRLAEEEEAKKKAEEEAAKKKAEEEAKRLAEEEEAKKKAEEEAAKKKASENPTTEK